MPSHICTKWSTLFVAVFAQMAVSTINGKMAEVSRCQQLLGKFVMTDQTVPPEAGTGSDVQDGIFAMGLSEALACADAAQPLAATHPANVAHFVENIARHPECMLELETKNQAETRCAQKLYKMAMHFMIAAGNEAGALAIWNRSVSLRANFSAAIRWKSLAQIPTIWLDGLTSSARWDCSRWPFIARLEVLAPKIVEEFSAFTSGFQGAYPYLLQAGRWDNQFLFLDGKWNADSCKQLPLICRFLASELPTKPGVPFLLASHEEVVIFKSASGAIVQPHCGATNGVINLHLTLSGGEEASLFVDGQTIPLQNGQTVCFQDSFFHAVKHRNNSAAERISLVIRVMHPELSLDSYAGSSRTDATEDLVAWDTTASLRLELERIRGAYRELAEQALLSDRHVATCKQT